MVFPGGCAAQQAIKGETGEAQVLRRDQQVALPLRRQKCGMGLGQQAVLTGIERGFTGAGQGKAGCGDHVGTQRIHTLSGQRGQAVARGALGSMIRAIGLSLNLPGAVRSLPFGAEPQDSCTRPSSSVSP